MFITVFATVRIRKHPDI